MAAYGLGYRLRVKRVMFAISYYIVSVQEIRRNVFILVHCAARNGASIEVKADTLSVALPDSQLSLQCYSPVRHSC